MRTTIQLDDAVLVQATELAREKGYDLSHLIEETLREKIAPTGGVARQPLHRLTTVGAAVFVLVSTSITLPNC
jgi:hypothetical protein